MLPARRHLATTLALLLLATAAACGSGGDGGSGGTPTLKFYVFKEPGGAFAQAAQACTEQAGGRYRVELADLPPSADQQREQLVRRLAAEDSDIDIMGMDVIWTAEFAEAGWLLPWDGDAAAKATDGTIAATIQTGTYEGKLYAAPFTTNTQLLWYRKDRVPNPPADLGRDGRHGREDRRGRLIQVQGNRYEGLTVWFNSLLASARGSVLKGAGQVDLATEPATRALEVIKRVATSRAADPTLSTSPGGPGPAGLRVGQLVVHGQLHASSGPAPRRTPPTWPRTWAGPRGPGCCPTSRPT